MSVHVWANVSICVNVCVFLCCVSVFVVSVYLCVGIEMFTH